MAWQAWRGSGDQTLAELGAEEVAPRAARVAFRHGLLVGALNPEDGRLLPRVPASVRDPGAGPVWAQLVVLGLLFIALATLVDAQWAMAGATLRSTLPNLRMRIVNRASAVVYAALAAVALSARRLTSA